MMAERGVRPDAISYTSAMGALGRSGSWERALALWQSMAAQGLEADSKAPPLPVEDTPRRPARGRRPPSASLDRV